MQRALAPDGTVKIRSETQRAAAVPLKHKAAKIINSDRQGIIQREVTPEAESSAQSPGGTGSGQSTTQSASGSCTPTSLSRRDFLSQTGNRQDTFGLTTLDTSQVTYPEVRTRRVRGCLRLWQTTATLPTISSIYTRAGTFTEGEGIVTGEAGECPQGRYPLRWTIDSNGAQKMAEGEQEHCDDFRYAFDISLRRYAEAVSRRLPRAGDFGIEGKLIGGLREMSG